MEKKWLIVVAGSTASGKTKLAIDIAQHFNTSILSADSRQCYKELNIGVARPTEKELLLAPHYFIASHSIHTSINAGFYEQYGLKILNHIFQEKNIAVVVGGTGLYIKALLEGMDDIPTVPNAIRQSVQQLYQTQGLQWLQQTLQAKDPLFYHQAEQQNPQRLMRALEVLIHTGQSIETFKKKHKKDRSFQTIKIALDWDRNTLYDRIHQRVDNMIEEGLEAEVDALQAFQHLNALQTVGYKELFAYFNKECSKNDAINAIKQNTRHYAKRQITWFKKDKDFLWVHPSTTPTILQHIQRTIYE